MERKQKVKDDIMDLLEGSYLPESTVFKTVAWSLNKLTVNELSSLYSMLLTRVKVAGVD